LKLVQQDHPQMLPMLVTVPPTIAALLHPLAWPVPPSGVDS
jgi:hypothetical protein